MSTPVAASPRRRQQHWLRDLPLARATALWLAVFVLAALAVVYLLGSPWANGWWPPQTGTLEWKDRLLYAGGVVTLSGAVVALVVNYRKQRDAEAGRFATSFADAARQLGDNSPSVRIAGIYALAALADAHQERRQQCIDVLCGYLRLPYSPQAGEGHLTEHTTEATDPDTLVKTIDTRTYRADDREVRLTIIRAIRDHLRATALVSWQGHDFNFTGATFDGGDFGGAVFSSGRVDFAGTSFPGGQVSFFHAVFSGAQVSFASAVYSGGHVDFGAAQFSGGEVDFAAAEFSGGRVYFSGAFSGSQVNFSGAGFSGAHVSFSSARFAGGQVHFISTRFSDGQVVFAGARFSGAQVDFGTAVFSGGHVDFGGAMFSGGHVDFGGAMFSGAHVSFGAVVLSGAMVDFIGAQFSGGQIDLSTAVFSGGQVDLSSAVFTGGYVSFRDAEAIRAGVRITSHIAWKGGGWYVGGQSIASEEELLALPQ